MPKRDLSFSNESLSALLALVHPRASLAPDAVSKLNSVLQSLTMTILEKASQGTEGAVTIKGLVESVRSVIHPNQASVCVVAGMLSLLTPWLTANNDQQWPLLAPFLTNHTICRGAYGEENVTMALYHGTARSEPVETTYGFTLSPDRLWSFFPRKILDKPVSYSPDASFFLASTLEHITIALFSKVDPDSLDDQVVTAVCVQRHARELGLLEPGNYEIVPEAPYSPISTETTLQALKADSDTALSSQDSLSDFFEKLTRITNSYHTHSGAAPPTASSTANTANTAASIGTPSVPTSTPTPPSPTIPDSYEQSMSDISYGDSEYSESLATAATDDSAFLTNSLPIPKQLNPMTFTPPSKKVDLLAQSMPLPKITLSLSDFPRASPGKRARTAYQFYCTHHRPALKKLYTDSTAAEITKKLSQEWKALSSSERSPYDDLSSQEKSIYRK